jgi:hypothetical protein
MGSHLITSFLYMRATGFATYATMRTWQADRPYR